RSNRHIDWCREALYLRLYSEGLLGFDNKRGISSGDTKGVANGWCGGGRHHSYIREGNITEPYIASEKPIAFKDIGVGVHTFDRHTRHKGSFPTPALLTVGPFSTRYKWLNHKTEPECVYKNRADGEKQLYIGRTDSESQTKVKLFSRLASQLSQSDSSMPNFWDPFRNWVDRHRPPLISQVYDATYKAGKTVGKGVWETARQLEKVSPDLGAAARKSIRNTEREWPVINCRAAVFWEAGKPLTIENITVDPPKGGEVRVRMVSAGLCASDAHYIWGQQTDADTNFEGKPTVLGHEGAGVVESVGEGVTSVKAGDHVIPLWMPNCEKCDLCAHPKTNFCLSVNPFETMYHQNRETRTKLNGNDLLLFSNGHRDFLRVHCDPGNTINPSADLKTVCVIGCAVGTGYGSAVNIARVHPGAKCAVWGLGAIGLSALLGCKQSGAHIIIGIDINPDKESVAKEFGCNQFINPKTLDEPIESYLQKMGGIDYAFDCIGNQQVLDSAYKSLSYWGSLTIIGLGPKGNKVDTKVGDFLMGRSVNGGLFGNYKPRKANQEMVDKYLSGSLPIDGLITHRIRLDEINEGFDSLKAGKTVRTVISCRAAVMWSEGTPLKVENITVDPPKVGEVRVRMVSAGVCASDGHFIWGHETDLSYEFEGNPVAMGHEGAGVVESVGDGVTSVEVGDKVMLLWMPECGRCALCVSPQTNFCLAANKYTVLYHDNRETRMKINGKPLLSYAGVSTFSEYVVVREIQLAKLNPSADLLKVGVIGCAVGTGYGSAVNIARVHPGAKCAVWGLGAIGLSALLGCKQSGAHTIIGVDINADKESVAKEFGCNQFINPKTLGEPIESYLQKMGGIDYAFDCIGNQQVLDSAYKSLTPWGSLTIIGLGPKGNGLNVKVAELVKGRYVLGGFFGNYKPRKANQELVDKYMKGTLPIDGLISNTIPLDDINKGFDDLKAGKTIRTVINCRAAVLWTPGTPLTIENITVDPPQEGEVRVRMVSAGLCASDGHFVWGWDTDIILDLEGNPLVMGHEGAGVVESVGPGVTSVAPGDHVIPMWMPECEKCDLCSHPKTNLCLSGDIVSSMYQKNKETRMKINGKPLLSMTGTGTFSEYNVLRETQVAKINPSADLKTVCVIGCAVGTGYGSAVNIARVHPGAKCAVWGLGAIGLSALLGCREAGAHTIIGVDINADKESIAKEFGCNQFINPKTLDEPIESYLQKMGGIDYAFDCIGNQQVLDSAYKSLSPWGVLTAIGLGPRGNGVNAKVADLVMGRTVTGGLFGNQKPRKTNQEMVDKYLSGSLPIDGLITHRIRLDEINEGFDSLKAGKTVRTVIEY
ncbi:unnamed protein product, partial [Medioppia subpectinata]